MVYPIDKISAQMLEINFQGNVIPASWKNHIRNKNKPDLNAMFLLSEIVYWYRPIITRDEMGNEVFSKKYKSDLLQKGYKQLEAATGLSEKQLREAMERLESLGLMKRHVRTIESYVKDSDEIRKIPNILFIEIFPMQIKEITYSGFKKEVLSFPTGNHTLPYREPYPSLQGTTYTETTTKTTTEIKGNVLESLPFSSEKEGVEKKNKKKATEVETKYPLKKEQMVYFDQMKDLDLGADDQTLIIIIRDAFKKGKEQKLRDAISHIKSEIDNGANFKKQKIALFRSVISGKVSPITERAIANKVYAEEAKKRASWSSLEIHDKFVVCNITGKEVPLDRPRKEFKIMLVDLYNLSKNYS